jgi:hypothetical protein
LGIGELAGSPLHQAFPRALLRRPRGNGVGTRFERRRGVARITLCGQFLTRSAKFPTPAPGDQTILGCGSGQLRTPGIGPVWHNAC